MNEELNITDLPKGWKWVKLGEIGKIETGTTPSKSNLEYYGKDVPFFKPSDLEQGIVTTHAYDNLSNLGFGKTRKLPKNTILVTCIGATIGKTGLIKVEGASNQQINSIIPDILYDPKFIFFQIISTSFQNQIKDNASSTTLPIINKSKFKNLNFITTKLDLQQAIVLKIEELFSELDKGIENLHTAQTQLKIYRQSVLKWAFEGKLTNNLNKALTEENDLSIANETKVVNQLKTDKSNSINQGSINEILPHGWNWSKIEDSTISLDNKRKPINKEERSKRYGIIPYFGANGRVGWIDDYIFDEPLVCVVEDETFTGREIPFSYKISGKSWVNNHAHVLKPKDDLNIDFLNYQLFYYPFLKLTTGTTGRKKLTKSALMNAPIKICSLKEQSMIVQAIESRLSITEKLEETIIQSLKQAEVLRQSILKRAFDGKLI